MKKITTLCICLLLFSAFLTGCGKDKTPKIGVAFGVGPAARWQQEKAYMEDYAKQLDVPLEVRMNTDEEAKPLADDCYELIDSGIDVLIIRPRDVFGMKDVVDYAREKNVKIISYDSLIEEQPVDLFVGYDSEHIGQRMGRFLSELAPKGDYILLWGDTNRNVKSMYAGAMKFLEPLNGDINILVEAEIPGWSSEEAKKIVKETVAANGNNVDAILAFNDTMAGAAIEAINELGITKPVYVTGMDAQIDAVRRIVEGTQSCTAYMDLKSLATTTIDKAVDLAHNGSLKANAEIDNDSGSIIPCYFLTRQLVSKENIDRILIESGYYTDEEVYGIPKAK